MTEWHIEGEWYKNCNCDPGCPCDFNQRPTQGFCEGMVAMRIVKGHFADTDMAGVKWGAIVHWPGALVRIPNGMEYTGPGEEAETALAKRISSRGAIEFEISGGHSSMAYVHHGSAVRTGAHDPTVVEQAFTA